MKKLIALLLVVVMAFTVIACSGSNTETTTPAGETTAPASTTPKEGTTTAAPTEAPTTATPTENLPDTVAKPDVTDLKDADPTVPEGWTRPTEYVRAADEDVYEAIMGKYADLLDAAKEEADIDAKFVLYAKAEAYLLDLAVMTPTTTQNGAYTISRIAPHTVPYVQWGNDDDRLFGLVISDEFLTKEERTELLAQWKAALGGESTYDPAAYLTSKGHTLNKNYNTTFSTACVTFDWLNTSSQSDTEVTVNTVDGLVQYDNLNRMQPALAESWSVSDDGLTYTFNIRKGVKWVTAEGQEYAELTAKDFESGFQHMLDCEAGLESLVDSIIVGVEAYNYEGGSFADVGYKATSDYVLTITLEKPTSYFMTMLTYSIFLPICTSFYQSRGGVFGKEAYAAASADTTTYTYGLNTDVSTQVYCGPFRLTKFNADSEILLVANDKYYNKQNVTLETIKFTYDDGKNPKAIYDAVCAGTYPGTGLTQASGTLDLAKADGNFDKYSYISDTTSTTYFGGLNLNRGTFVLENGEAASQKTDAQKIDTTIALQNKYFRQALQFAFDQGTYNAASRGEDLKYTNLRNMYTCPDFVVLSKDVVVDNTVFKAGTLYGDLVQAYLTEMGSTIKVADGQDGWFNPTAAKAALEKAKPVLTQMGVTFPVHIEVVYYSPAATNTAQAQIYKQVIEETLGTENVVVDLIETTTTDDFYACGYRARNGLAGNYDMFYGSGWGPDFGDPCTYLDTFLGYGAGYMCKVIGLF